MILASLILVGIVWLAIGLVLAFMAGVTHDFAKRHFEPALMIPMGPIGILAWYLCEKREARHGRKKRKI